MKVAKLYESGEKHIVSFEFFPPRDEKGAESFNTVIDELSVLGPDYISVTFGAGGSTRDGSCQTVKKLLADKGLPVVAYIAGYGLGPDEITEILDRYADLGVETILVIRGDKPKNGDFIPNPDSFSYASDMIAFIKKRYDFTLGCAGYPEGHIQAESLDKDIEYLKLKIDNGAEYVICQYCYDNNYFYDYLEKCRGAGISTPIIIIGKPPALPGRLPEFDSSRN